jgi:hypothetical protein
MKQASLFTSPLILAALIACGGCDGSRTSDYPDRQPETVRRVDDIKRNAQDQKTAIEREYEEISAKLDFRERQIRERHKADRDAFALQTNKDISELQAKRREIDLQAKHDKDKVDAETAEKARTSPADQAAQIQTDASARKSDIDANVAKQLAPIMADIERHEAKVRQRRSEIDLAEAKDLSGLERERTQAKDQMRTKKIDVDRWLTDELAKVDKEIRGKSERR